jgi:diaminopimelate decarboxylase
VPVALRVNPEVTVDTPHHYTRTGEKGMKFGIPHDQARETGREALAMRGVELVGLDMHVGSQVSGVEPYRLGLERLVALVHALRADGATSLRCLDVGGGLAVPYDASEDAPADVDSFARTVADATAALGVEVIVEPGRFLVADAGILVTRVLFRKHSGGREIVIVDAGMNDLLRPSHYNAFHRIEAVEPHDGERESVDLVGPICETGDFLALDRQLEVLAPGDLVAVHTAGAYGFAMASQYNSRPRAPEVLVDEGRWAVIRERETYEDLVRHETAHPDWRIR